LQYSEQAPRRVAAARCEVDGEHRLDACAPAPLDELVGAERVRLGRVPGEVEAARTPLARADAVFPVVAGDEVAAGIAHHRRRQLADEIEHVAAKAARVCARMAGLVEAAVDRAPDVLDERTEEPPVGRADDVVPVKGDRDLAHGPHPPKKILHRRREQVCA
jgi:hypothetical protein